MPLREEKKDAFGSLHSHCSCDEKPCRETTLMKIYDINSFEIVNDKPQRTNYIYHFASRMNHECLPNMARGNTKNAPWIIANKNDSEILSKPTLEEIQPAKQVESWFKSFSQAAAKAGDGITTAIDNGLLRGQSTRERRHIIVESKMQTSEDYLRKNNTYGQSDR